MSRFLILGGLVSSVMLLSACAPDYSPNTYASNAVQQANKVDAGIVIGFREVMISANGTVGAVTGGAAGGVLGASVGASRTDQALGSVAGSAVGSILGKTIEHVTGDTKGWEYIVKKNNGDYVSVTQTEETPLSIGQHVLVIAGPQARVIADYSVDLPSPHPTATTVKQEKPSAEPPTPPVAIEETPISPPEPPLEKPVVTDLPPPPASSELPPAAPFLPTPIAGSSP